MRESHGAFDKFKYRIGTKTVVQFPQAPFTSILTAAGPSRLVMKYLQLRNRFRFPSHHSDGSLRMPVLAPVLQNCVASERFITFSPDELGRMGYGMGPVGAPAGELAIDLLADKTARKTQPRIEFELPHQFFKVRVADR